MAVVQNECYRLVTIGYLKNFIKSGSKYLIQKNDGTYVNLDSRTDTNWCPTYGDLTGGTIVPMYSKGTSPKNDTDGLIIKSTAVLGGTYANNQCVDRGDLSLAYTRLSALQVGVGKYTFNGCGESAQTEVEYEYSRTTKTMSNCPSTESSIIYDISTTTVSAPCSELTFKTTLGSSVSSASCTNYKIEKNTGSTVRNDGVVATVTFRGSTISSNTAPTTQPPGDGAYSSKVSERNVPTGISDLIPSPSNYQYTITPSGSACTQTTRSISLGGKGVYDHYETYAYVRCGVVDPSVPQKEFLISTNNKVNLTPVSGTLAGSGTCCDGNSKMDTKTLTLSWSGLSVSKEFSLICSSCSGSTACTTPAEECCQIVGPYSVSCSGNVQYKIGECGCDGTIDLGLSVEWSEYPFGTADDYAGVAFNASSSEAPTGFTFFQFGYHDKWNSEGTGGAHIAYDGDLDPSKVYPYDTVLDSEHDAAHYWLGGKYRMPSKEEAQELIDNTTKEWKTDYKGISGLNGLLLTSTKSGFTDKSIFLPATGEWYPEDEKGGEGTPVIFRYAGLSIYIRLRDGKWIKENDPSAYRIYCGNSGDTLRVVDSSRRYGNLIFPVCDKT